MWSKFYSHTACDLVQGPFTGAIKSPNPNKRMNAGHVDDGPSHVPQLDSHSNALHVGAEGVFIIFFSNINNFSTTGDTWNRETILSDTSSKILSLKLIYCTIMDSLGNAPL